MENISNLLTTKLSIKIIKALVNDTEREFTYHDILLSLKTHPTRTYTFLRSFSDAGIITKGKKIKNWQFHKFNKDHPQAKLLQELFNGES